MCKKCDHHGHDSSDKDSPNGIILSYNFHIAESMFTLPPDEYKLAIERQLHMMYRGLVDKAIDHYIERSIEGLNPPTEFTGMP